MGGRIGRAYWAGECVGAAGGGGQRGRLVMQLQRREYHYFNCENTKRT